MRHNSVVSGHLKSTGIPRVDRLSTGPPNLGRHVFASCQTGPLFMNFFSVSRYS